MNITDGLGETSLGLALWTEQFDIAQRLLQMGAELEVVGKVEEERGEPGLLYVAIIREKARACLFLLEHGADFKTRFFVLTILCFPFSMILPPTHSYMSYLAKLAGCLFSCP